ncbi:MAG: DNA-binding response regulator [Hydrogenophilales bacterium 12-61-10]|nr:MAG: DNA-binding response regulator [Hydrogenophilales bacterium 12-61-10]OYX29435.1 MAG: DNA-binding response regulator [Hydrogenophilales bacterium 32-62-9]
MHLLLIEDDLDLGGALQRALGGYGFACTWVRSVRDAHAQASGETALFACAVLDLGLPDGQGLDLLRRWRRNQLMLPVIVLTARDAVSSRVDGLDAGADDYVVKPVAPEELASRIRAVTRRATGQASSAWEVGKLYIDVGKREVRFDGSAVALSPREFQIVEELARNAGEVVPKHRMARALQPFGEPLEFSTLDWHIHNLRRKLGTSVIHTVRGVGYSLFE